MQLIIYESVSAAPKAFIEFWADRYMGYDDDIYDANAGQELTEARILDLFKWKKGTKLSGSKHTSVMKNFVALSHELADRRNQTASQLLAHFANGAVI